MSDSVWPRGIVADNVARPDWAKQYSQENGSNGGSKRGRVCVVLVGSFH